MKAIKQNIGLGVLCLAMLATAVILILNIPVRNVYGSTSRGSEYQATTTTAQFFPKDAIIYSGSGTFGSVVITGAAVGTINFYDATTSDITQRSSSQATSSILLATFPASAPAGTYTFDQSFYRGLIVNIVGVVPTTTITYRQ